MERRKFVIGLGSLAAGSAATIGTGAFNNATIQDRQVTVGVSHDKNALVGLQPTGGDKENSYVVEYHDGEMALDFRNAADNGGAGVNQDSVYEFHEVFQVVHQGSDDPSGVDIWITDDNERVEWFVDSDPDNSIEGKGNRFENLKTGGRKEIGVRLDLDGYESLSDFSANATVHVKDTDTVSDPS